MDISKLLENYEKIKKVGEGAFGEVYKIKNKKTGKIFAVKIEKNDIKRLIFEKNVYKILNSQKNDYIPNLISFNHDDKTAVMIIDYLGPSLSKLHDYCDQKFTLKTTLYIAIKSIRILEYIHNNGIIHRDIKPENFLIGNGKKFSKRLYIVDFGLSKKFIEQNNHIPFKSGKGFTGSYRYCSLRGHEGIESSRRDDLESLGNVLIFFLLGKLPWQGIEGTKSTRSKRIYQTKKKISLEDLCKDIPHEFYEYMKYCRLLRFSERPDYDYLIKLFCRLFNKQNFENDTKYDWESKYESIT